MGVDETLMLLPNLRAFSSYQVPRILDLLILLNRQCRSIESIQIAAFAMSIDRHVTQRKFQDTIATIAPRRVQDTIAWEKVEDTIGLRQYPALDVHHWNYLLRASGIEVPFANTINLPNAGNTTTEKLVFDFPKLRILSLTEIQHDGRTNSPYFAPLVVLLKGSPNLENLQVWDNHITGGLQLDGTFLPGMYSTFVGSRHGTLGGSTGIKGFLKCLCTQYKDWWKTPAAQGSEP